MKIRIILVSSLLVFILMKMGYGQDSACGNGICDSYDTHYSCPEDCPSGSFDGYCDNIKDDICDRDCIKSDSDCDDYERGAISPTKKSGGLSTLLKVAIAVVFVTISSAILYFFYKKANSHMQMYDEDQIDKFSNIKKEKDQNNWSEQSETQIMKKIKQSEDFKRYAGGQN